MHLAASSRVIAVVLSVSALAAGGLSAAATAAPYSSLPPATAGVDSKALSQQRSGPTYLLVTRRDVDGDGRRDRVYVAELSDDRAILRVDRARGRTLHRSLNTELWYGKAWHGAANIDGRDGFELVTGDAMGAHTLFFDAWTYRAGRLVRLRAPSSNTWVVDGSYSFNLGVWRRTPGSQVLVVLKSALRDRDGKGHHGKVGTYRWDRGGWKRISVQKRSWTDHGAYRISGWHVTGLPRFF